MNETKIKMNETKIKMNETKIKNVIREMEKVLKEWDDNTENHLMPVQKQDFEYWIDELNQSVN